MDTIQDIADRLERAADRYQNAADFQAANDARNAAQQVRRASSVLEAQQIEQMFINAHRGGTNVQPPPDYQNLSQNSGCLGGLFGGNSRGAMRPTGSSAPWRGTTAGGGTRIGYGGPYYSSHHYFVSPGYSQYTLAEAASRHLPPGYSDPALYAQHLAGQTGIDPNTRIGDLSPEQLANVTSAIDTHPNWAQADSLPDIAPGAASHDASDNSSRDGGGDFSTGKDFGADSGSSRDGGADYSTGTDFTSAASGASSTPSDNS
jgi:hypothetical protein